MARPATRSRLLSAARELLVRGGRPPSAAAIATQAGVSRLTVYHHFGSHAGLRAALAAEARSGAPAETAAGPPLDRLRSQVEAACARWSSDPALFRRLPAAAESRDGELVHALAISLAEADRLRPGCSLREAEDVIGLITSFAAFDRLHHDGRRSQAAVAEILMRMAAGILAS